MSADGHDYEAGTSADEPMCFVIGPIGDKLADIDSEERKRYELAIQTLENVVQPACQELSITPTRADSLTVSGEITEQAFRLIRDADIVIADLTDANPNVMHELGLRHTRNRLTIQLGERGKLPFDIHAIRTIQFKRSQGGYIDARNELRKSLESGITGGFDPVTATRLWMELSTDTTEQSSSDDDNDDDDGGGVRVEIDPRRPNGDEGPGYLELLSEAEETFPRVVVTLENIGRVTVEFGEIAQKGTAEIEDINQQGGGAKERLLAAIRFAERLDEPSDRLEELASSYRADVYGLDAAMNVVFGRVEGGEYDPEETDEIASTLRMFIEFGEIVQTALPNIQGFRTSVEETGSLARPVRVRARRLVSLLDSIIKTSETFLAWGERAEPLLDLPDFAENHLDSEKTGPSLPE